VLADLVEVLLAHVVTSLLCSSHSLSKLSLDFEKFSFLKTLSSILSKCNSVLSGKANLLQFLTLGSSLLELFINLLESHGLL